MALTPELEEYALSCQEELIDLIKKIAVIPAPSHFEDDRVAFVKKWMEDNGAENVFVDKAKNVIWPVNVTEDNDLVVIMAHTDIVFPRETPLKVTERDGKLWCPGIGDDTARLACLLMGAKYLMSNGYKPDTGVLFVANSCEEGLGNLKGSREIVNTYKNRIKNFITIDGKLGVVVTRPVGSHRYRVTVRTEGGHSYGAFGNRNAIRVMASLIDTFYTIKVPQVGDSKTTYNVGTITGGTTVNTIAQECSMLFEYRSNDKSCIDQMKDMFYKIIEGYRATGVQVEVELLGERPCMGEVDKEEWEELIKKVTDSYAVAGYDTVRGTGSTDANTPLAAGIPAVCVGSVISGNTHRLDEWCEIESLKAGMRFVLDLFSKYFKK